MTNNNRPPYEAWDKLIASEAFGAYLVERGLTLHQIPAPPRDLPAEQAALGAMLMGDQKAVETGVHRLRPCMFYNESNHRPTLIAIARINRQRQQGKSIEVDLISVCTQLRRSKELEGEGGSVSIAYLTTLIEGCPSSRNIDAYIDAIIETARLRSLLQLSRWLQETVLAPEANPERLCNHVRKAVDAIENRGLVDLINLQQNEK